MQQHATTAMREFLSALLLYGDATLNVDMARPAPVLPRYRVTRRGNLYDNTEGRTIWHTHGLGSIKARTTIAAWWAGIMNARRE